MVNEICCWLKTRIAEGFIGMHGRLRFDSTIRKDKLAWANYKRFAEPYNTLAS